MPFWLAQLRKRTFAIVHAIDRQAATFLGRPPTVNYRYCSNEPPLNPDGGLLRLEA